MGCCRNEISKRHVWKSAIFLLLHIHYYSEKQNSLSVLVCGTFKNWRYLSLEGDVRAVLNTPCGWVAEIGNHWCAIISLIIAQGRDRDHSCADSGFTLLKSHPSQWCRGKVCAPRNESEISQRQAALSQNNFSLEKSSTGTKETCNMDNSLIDGLWLTQSAGSCVKLL